MAMTHAERLMAVCRREQPDSMPWVADLTYWYGAAEYRGDLPDRWRGEGAVDLYRDLDVGAAEHCLNTPWRVEYEDVECKTDTETDSDGRPWRQRDQWITPVGTIEKVSQYEPLSFCWAYREYPVKTVEDLRVLRFVFAHEHISPDYAHAERQNALWKGWGVPSSVPPRCPLANLLVIWMGVQSTVYALADAPAEVEATLAVQEERDDKIYEVLAHTPSPLICLGENITSEVVSPKLFTRYYAPYFRKRTRQIHDAGKHCFVHIDGTMRGVLELVADTGIDCAQSLTPAPVGDVAVSDMRALAGPDLILWGGVPAAYFSPVYPEGALRDIVMECIRYHLGGPFILGVCDQVPPDGIIQRVKLVSELVAEHGGIL